MQRAGGGRRTPPTQPLQFFRYTLRLIVATVDASTASTLQQTHLHHAQNTL
jgi:hypothetical protein